MRTHTTTSPRRHAATSWRRTFICAVLTLGLGGVRAFAVTPVTLVGPDLQPQAIHLTSVRDGQIGYFDQTRQLRRAPLTDYVQIRGFPPSPADAATPDEAASAATGAIELIDGTRLAGRLEGVAADGQSLQWSHDGLGRIDVTLDELAMLWLGRPPGRSEQPASDRVVLVNGDVIEGFLERLVALRVQGSEQLVEAPLERLAAVVMSNPRRLESLDRLLLTDGSRLGVSSFAIEGDRLRATVALLGGTRQATWPLHAFRRIDLSGSGLSLVQLTDLPWRTITGGRVFGVAWPPRVSDDQLHLHAPVAVEIELPDGAQRLAARVELALEDVPAHARPLADCALIVAVDGAPVLRLSLNSANPAATINLPVRAGKITFTLDPGLHGPTLDRVRLTDAIVLIRVPREP